jgi:DNA-binding transcriptional ArsR family regulator
MLIEQLVANLFEVHRTGGSLVVMPAVAEPPSVLDVTRVLHALADPVRFELVRQLRSAQDPIACGRFDTPVAKSTLSHHFKILREAGIVATTRDRGRTLNTLRTREIEEAFPGLLDAILPAGKDARTRPPKSANTKPHTPLAKPQPPPRGPVYPRRAEGGAPASPARARASGGLHQVPARDDLQ